jgi:hypothetical protein
MKRSKVMRTLTDKTQGYNAILVGLRTFGLDMPGSNFIHGEFATHIAAEIHLRKLLRDAISRLDSGSRRLLVDEVTIRSPEGGIIVDD